MYGFPSFWIECEWKQLSSHSTAKMGNADDDDGDDTQTPANFEVIVILMSCLEVLLLVASLVAATLHKQGAGGGFTRLTYFHFAHSAFCSYYIVWEALQIMFDTEWPGCGSSLYSIRFTGLDVLFITTWALFADYWERVLGSVNEQRWRLRATLFFIVVFIGAVGQILYNKAYGCDDKVKYATYAGWFIFRCPIAALLLLDSSRLARISYRRVLAMERQRIGSDRSDSTAKSTMKIILKAWYLFGICAAALGYFILVLVLSFKAVLESHYFHDLGAYTGPAWELMYYIIPGMLMLRATWKRRYLSPLSEDRTPSEATAFEQVLNSGYALEGTLGERFLDDDDDDERYSETLDRTGTHYLPRDEESTTVLRNLLSETPGWKSHFNFKSTHRIPVVVNEELAPPNVEMFAPVVRLFLQNIALPHAKQKAAKITASVQHLLQRTRPVIDRRGSIGIFAAQTEHSDLQKSCDEIREDIVDWVTFMQILVEKISALEAEHIGNNFFFKRSAMKKVKGLAFFSTNLQVHSAEVRTAAAAAAVPGNDAARGNWTRVISVTYGAPAAHTLGWKLGFQTFNRDGRGSGEGDGEEDDDYDEEFDEESSHGAPAGRTPVRPIRKSSGDSLLTRDLPVKATRAPPQRLLRSLHVELAQEKREAVVISQALGALVAACGEHLADSLRRRDTAALLQMQAIGLLLHEVCLLSTSGHERKMIEDMAAALARLRVVIRLELADDSNGGAVESSQAEGAEGGNSEPHMRVTNVAPTNPALDDDGTIFDKHGLAFAAPMGEMTLTLQVVTSDPELRAFFTATSKMQPMSFIVMPVLFNLGVNEMQSVSNAIGSYGVQTRINKEGMNGLREYYELYVEYSRTSEHEQQNTHNIERLRGMLALLENLIEAEASGGGKHVNLLLYSSFCARWLNGARTTSCKSAKDRTSMFQTLEDCQIALRDGIIRNADEMQMIIDELRGNDGVRLCNAEANTGSKKFAFNSVQVKALPKELRPPITAASGAVVS